MLNSFNDNDGLKDYFKTANMASSTYDKYVESVKKANEENKKFSISSQLASIGSSALSDGLNGIVGSLTDFAISGLTGLAANIVSGLIGMAVNAFDEWIRRDEIAIQKAQELQQEYQQAQEAYQQNVTTLQGLEGEFATLSAGVDTYGNNISLTADEYARYKEIVQQIAEISPSLVLGYDAENQAIIDKNRLIERSIELQKEQAKTELEKKTSLPNLKTALEGNLGEYNQALGSQAEYSKAYGYDLSLRGLPISLRVCARIILAESLLFLPSIFRILFFYGILAQTRCDIDTSSLCVLDSLCHLVFYFPF